MLVPSLWFWSDHLFFGRPTVLLPFGMSSLTNFRTRVSFIPDEHCLLASTIHSSFIQLLPLFISVYLFIHYLLSCNVYTAADMKNSISAV